MTCRLLILAVLLPLAAPAQQSLILLDPARGGADSGAHIANQVPEKQVTLDVAGRLASLLRARGFTVAMTRETDVGVTGDARAAQANNLRPLACLSIYAVPNGSGVHLYTSALRQTDPSVSGPAQWDQAQGAFADRSRALAADLRSSLEHARLTASAGQTWMRPLDNMQCPAVAVEIAPEKDGTGPDTTSYQSRIGNAVANTLLQWRSKVAAMEPHPAVTPPASVPATNTAPRPATSTPAGTATQTSPSSPAPVIRMPPATPSGQARPSGAPTVPGSASTTSGDASERRAPAVSRPAPATSPTLPAAQRPSAPKQSAPRPPEAAPERVEP